MKKLTNKQKQLLDELFTGQLSEQEILEKLKIRTRVFENWLSCSAFQAAIGQRIASAFRQSTLLLARYAPLAAARLIALTESDKPETARRACLDIISFGSSTKPATAESDDDKQGDNTDGSELTEAEAERILAALACSDQVKSAGET